MNHITWKTSLIKAEEVFSESSYVLNGIMINLMRNRSFENFSYMKRSSKGLSKMTTGPDRGGEKPRSAPAINGGKIFKTGPTLPARLQPNLPAGMGANAELYRVWMRRGETGRA